MTTQTTERKNPYRREYQIGFEDGSRTTIAFMNEDYAHLALNAYSRPKGGHYKGAHVIYREVSDWRPLKEKEVEE